MAQVYKMMLGTSGKQWELLTVKDDGTMTMTFHGTDREICHEVTENADGWLCYPGAMYPGLASGKWQLTEEEPIVTVAAKPQPTEQVREPQPVVEAQTAQQQLEPVVVETKPKHQRRQRKPRKPRVERQEPLTVNPDCNATLSEKEPLTVNHQTSSTLKAIGMVAAATVALFVIYETGLLIPLGLIGLATGGILK